MAKVSLGMEYHVTTYCFSYAMQVISNRKADFTEDNSFNCLGQSMLNKYRAECPQDRDLGKGMLTQQRSSAGGESFKCIR